MNNVTNRITIDNQMLGYWRATLYHPPINTIDDQMYDEVFDLVEAMEADPSLKVVTFESANPDFFLAHYGVAESTSRFGKPRWIETATRLARSNVLSIAVVRGRARGGGSELALACDIRFASREKAIFGQPEVGCGLIPGGGALERLPLLVGRGRAIEIVLGSDDFNAETAERYGWINRAIPDAELRPSARPSLGRAHSSGWARPANEDLGPRVSSSSTLVVRSRACRQSMSKHALVAFATLLLVLAPRAWAQNITEAQARAIIAPWYSLFNVASRGDAKSIQEQVLAADYESCAGYLPGECWGRDTSIKVVGNFSNSIPDMKFDIKEVLVVGDRVIVRGEVTGTPAGQLLGVPIPAGASA
jgi:enoyl-CoA hydratase/carnithine racemase